MNSDLSAAEAVEVHVPGFHLGEMIGRGGASRVWAGERLVDGARVAVKVTSPGRLHVGQLLELAAREIAVLDRVRHEHIIRLHEAHPLPDGSVAVVLDLADGGDLDALVRSRGRLPAGEVATMCTPLAGALAALHAAGVIHGDLSPRNVLFAADGRPLLGDFEAARLVGEGHPPLVAGTPGFLAPEVASGEIPTEASDIYGLGAIAWFALTGRALTPTVGAPATAVRAPDLAEATALVGRGFAAVVCAMLAADPADRPRADQAAVWCYEAAVPAPVGLVTPGSAVGLRGELSRVDPDSALTQRLRESAGRSSHAASPEPTSVRRRRTGHRATRRTRLLGGIRAWPVLTVATAVALAVSLGAAALRAESDQERGGAVAGQQSPSPSTTGEAPSSAPSNPLSGSRRSSLPTVDPAAVLAGLAQARAAALVSADPGALAASAAQDSPMLRNDAEVVEQLRVDGRRYADLAFFVRQARWLADDGETATMRALVERSAYRVIGPGAAVQEFAGDAGTSYVYTLVRTAYGWRLAGVSE